MFSSESEQHRDATSKFEEIVNILVAAGYFRARLTSLTPFDRIVGGMCWGITASAVDVDVDVVFQENSTIGQKIKISDQIVKSLRRMRSPYPLMSHQIQGLDYPALFPVCQWLVLKVIENRRNTGDVVRAFSESQFNKVLSLPHEDAQRIHTLSAAPFLRGVVKRYHPQRRFRTTEKSFASRSAHVHSVLLEYGAQMRTTVVVDESETMRSQKPRRPQSARMSIGADGEIHTSGDAAAETHTDLLALASRLGISADSLDADAIAALASDLAGGALTQDLVEKEESKLSVSEREAKQKAEEQLLNLQRQLQEMGGDDAVVKASSVGALVGLQSEQIKQAAEAAAQASSGGAAQGDGGHVTQIQMLERQTQALQRLIATHTEKTEQAKTAHTVAFEEVTVLQQKLDKRKTHNQRVVTETEKLKEQEKGKNQTDLSRLRELVSLNERLKQQEVDFRETCKKQLAELRGLMKQAEQGVSEEEDARMKQIEEMYTKDNTKFSKIRAATAGKNQEIALLTRKIDEVPTRTELIQYERSFVELYDQVSAKLEETRRYYDQYNTLESKRNFLSREVELLNSIYEWFKVPPTSKQHKEKILEALNTYVRVTKENLDKATQRLDSELLTRDKVAERYAQLVETQRQFFKAVKDFQDECTKNEQLSAALQRAQS